MALAAIHLSIAQHLGIGCCKLGLEAEVKERLDQAENNED